MIQRDADDDVEGAHDQRRGPAGHVDASGSSLALASTSYVQLVAVRRETRSLAELEKLVEERVPWRLVEGRLELRR